MEDCRSAERFKADPLGKEQPEMKCLRLDRYALSAGVAVALLAGCGGSQPPIGAPGAMPQIPRSQHTPIGASRGCCRKQSVRTYSTSPTSRTL